MNTAYRARLAAPLLLLLLTGCDDDKPYSGPPPGAGMADQSAPAPAIPPPPAAAPASPDAAPDPLLGGASPDQSTSDPLLSQDPMQGPKMPTAHSHWLRGRLRDARLTVLLNGVRQGAYFSLVDQDITMRLRKGINSVTFVYQPDTTSASAEMEVLESEHDPPIPPLVVFQSPPVASDDRPKPLTRTFSFVAN